MNSVAPVKRHALARLVLVLWTVVGTALGLALVATLCAILVPPIRTDPAFFARFSVLPGFLYLGQPAKTAAYEACVLAAPLLTLGFGWVGKQFIFSLEAATLRRWVGIGLAVHLLLFAACVRPIFYDPHPPLWLVPRWLLIPVPFPPPVPAWEWIASMLLAFVLVFVCVAGFPRAPLRRFVVRLLAVLAILCAPVEFYAPSQINSTDTTFSYHLNVMLDALSQVVNGHHLLVDFPHIYGGYIEMLAPVLRLFPRTFAVPLIALALPTVLAIWFWLLAGARLWRHPAILALGGMALLGATYLTALPPSYCYSTPRTFFPALGLWLAIGYLREPSGARFWLISVIAALASIWNLDTGIVLWIAWTITLLAGDANARAWKSAALHLLAQIVLLAVAWLGFLSYLRLVAHGSPDLNLLFYFQKMVVQSGYFCVPLVVPGAWTFVALLYVAGLVVATLAHLRGRVPWKGRVVLFLTLLGIGMFSYYMGRSAASNLIAVAPPGIVLVGIFADGALARMRHELLPPITRWFILPWALMIFWWALLFFAQLPAILHREARLVRDSFAVTPTPVQLNAQFAAQQTTPGEADVYFLSGNSGLYYYVTGTVRSLRIPGNATLLQMRDMEVLIHAIEAGQIPKLFVERNFWSMDMYRPEVYSALTQALAAHYRVVSASPGGLTLDVPKAATVSSAP